MLVGTGSGYMLTSPFRRANRLAWVQSFTWSLEKVLAMGFLTAFSLMPGFSAISMF